MTAELPDNLRIPLHELQADAAYLIGRVAADGAASGLVLESIRSRLQLIETSAVAIATELLAAGETEARLLRCIHMAMGCLDPHSSNRDEALAWYRLLDAKDGCEPRAQLEKGELGCFICANGNDLGLGDVCQSCGREGPGFQ